MPHIRKITDDAEFEALLAEKYREEAAEYAPGDPKSISELADGLEVIEELANLRGISFDELRSIQAKRREERGGFGDRSFVKTLEVADDDKWANYYASDPKKFPEEK